MADLYLPGSSRRLLLTAREVKSVLEDVDRGVPKAKIAQGLEVSRPLIYRIVRHRAHLEKQLEGLNDGK